MNQILIYLLRHLLGSLRHVASPPFPLLPVTPQPVPVCGNLKMINLNHWGCFNSWTFHRSASPQRNELIRVIPWMQCETSAGSGLAYTEGSLAQPRFIRGSTEGLMVSINLNKVSLNTYLAFIQQKGRKLHGDWAGKKDFGDCSLCHP